MKSKVADNKLTLVAAVSNSQLETQENMVTAISSAVTEQWHHFPGVTIGRLVGFQEGRPLVYYPGYSTDTSLVAQTVVTLTPDKIDKPILLVFENDNPKCPVIIGLIVEPEVESTVTTPVNLEIDGERLLLTAEREIVLRCGESSITLTRAGK
ncbi:MAG: DUF6484 domain-containing protein, partial [Methylococcales bacterium]